MIERATVAVQCRPVRLLRKTFIAGTLLSTIVATSAQSDYPNRPVQLIVPYGAGGIADVGMRILADQLTGRAETTVRRREPSRSRRNPRRESRRVGCSRRLYRVDDWQQQRDQRVSFQVTALQHPYGLRLDFDYFLL